VSAPGSRTRPTAPRGALLALLALLAGPAGAGAPDDLLAAVRARDAGRVRRLLDARADVNASTGSGWTPLMEAARAGDARVARLLLDRGASVDARDRLEGTALDVAERAGQAAMARLLRERGARGSGKSVGDRVCSLRWSGHGFCGRIESVEPTRYRIRVDAVAGCEGGCPAEDDCSAGRPVGGPGGLRAGETVWTRSWCLTHTGLP
jgi:ankyrin repeat protein